MSKALVAKNNIRKYDLQTPAQMSQMAKVLQKHIGDQGLSTNIGGKNYTNVEGWQFAGGLLGYMPRVKNVENLSTGTEKKWRADVELVRIKDNMIMGNGSALCSSLEVKKRSFDEYAIMSMAQTRAIGKAYRNLIGWVMKMAGYEGTPREEMGKVDDLGGQTTNTATRVYGTPSGAQNSPKNNIYANADKAIVEIKKILWKVGGKTESQALEIFYKKTGIKWTNFKSKTAVQANQGLANLLNNKK